MRFLSQKIVAVTFVVFSGSLFSAEWVNLSNQGGRRIDYDNESVKVTAEGESTVTLFFALEGTATGKISLEKNVFDHKTSQNYRVIELENRFHCGKRTYSALRRSYYQEDGTLLYHEEIKEPMAVAIRNGAPEEVLSREFCRPKPKPKPPEPEVAPLLLHKERLGPQDKTAEKLMEVAAILKRTNERLLAESVSAREVSKPLQTASRSPSAPLSNVAPRTDGDGPAVATHSGAASGVGRLSKMRKDQETPVIEAAAWDYKGKNAPEHWGQLSKEYALCHSGLEQSPIDIKDGILLDLDPITLDYKNTHDFRVADRDHMLQLTASAGQMQLYGLPYELLLSSFHHPSENTIDGLRFPMEVQFLHANPLGQLAIVSVFFQIGEENRAIQTVLNHIPLQKGGQMRSVGQAIDLSYFLPKSRAYYTFLGSLTTPPCTEKVQWIVFKEAVSLSKEQLSIFERLHLPNIRPLQNLSDRIIKESR